MSHYYKAIAAFLGGLSQWGITAFATDGLSSAEWFGVIGVLAATLLVFAVPNTPIEPAVPTTVPTSDPHF